MMGRRRARPVATAKQSDTGFSARQSPAGVTRLVWSYVAALVAAPITGLGFAIADSIQSTGCAEDDPFCALGIYLIGGLIGGVTAVALVGWLFRLGCEWSLVCVAVVVAMPTLLDTLGAVAWVVLAATPAVAALATWGGPERARWRPIVIGMVAGAVIAWVLISTLG